MPTHLRISVLRQVAEQLLKRHEDFAEVIAKEGIKTLREARKEVTRCIETLRISTENDQYTPEARLAVAAKIIERAGKLGIGPEDVVIDPLVLTMGADHNAGRVTLDTIELVVKEFGVNITKIQKSQEVTYERNSIYNVYQRYPGQNG